MARWIFQFRSAGERLLTEEERSAVTRLALGMRIRRVGFAVASVVAFLGALLFVAVAAGSEPNGWVGVLVCTIGGCILLGFASAAEKRALLYRRALRLGTVERFERVPGDTTSRTCWDALHHDDEGELEIRPMGDYWKQEEYFEEGLAKTAHRNPDSFEAVSLDGVPLFVEGKAARSLMEAYVWVAPD